MDFFNWDHHFETGIGSVDAQHHTLVNLINRFGQLLIRPGDVGPDALQSILAELAAYARDHFVDEEQLMQKVGLDPKHVTRHKQFHDDFLREVTQMKQHVVERGASARALLKFLTYWLAFHILGIDQAMARQIAAVKSGQTAVEAYRTEESRDEGATEPLLVALNGLFQHVSERNRELNEMNASLEAKVAERTRSLSEANSMLEQMALTDVLTGLPNRRHAMARLALAWDAAQSSGVSLACMMIDADGFKRINDQCGHDAGDEVLRQLSKVISYAIRTDDIACRLGGDEFLILCEATDLDGALLVAQALRNEVASLNVALNAGQQWSGSVSVGVAIKTDAMRNPEDLIKAADEALYLAKRNGRNRVEWVSV